MEQLAIVCPNLQRLNFKGFNHCLKNLQGLQAIASHCHNLQGLNLLCICVEKVEDHVRLWEILSNMKLTHLGVDFCVLRSDITNKKKLICSYQKCWTIRGIQCGYCCESFTNQDTLMFSYFPSLNYFHLSHCYHLATIAQDVINNCNKVKVFYCCYPKLSLNLAHNHNLQQLCIDSYTDVPDIFMTSVSVHGGLVHVVMSVRSVTAEGIIFLVRNSPKLITLHLCVEVMHPPDVNFDTSLKKTFCNRKLFTTGHYMVDISKWYGDLRGVIKEQGTDLLPLW